MFNWFHNLFYVYPWEYTKYEGGTFHKWEAGHVHKMQLKQRSPDCVIVNGKLVHSLIFETAMAGHGNYGRWDCLNGWTTTIKQAQKQFPQGLHNKPKYRN